VEGLKKIGVKTPLGC